MQQNPMVSVSVLPGSICRFWQIRFKEPGERNLKFYRENSILVMSLYRDSCKPMIGCWSVLNFRWQIITNQRRESLAATSLQRNVRGGVESCERTNTCTEVC